MKKSFYGIFIATIFLVFSASLSAQVLSSEMDYEHCSNEKVLNLGRNGIAVIGSDPFAKPAKDPAVIRVDSTAKKMWQKSYPQPYGNGRFDLFANSADGNDIYILSFKSIEKKENGGTDLALTWVDANSGESRMKEFPGTGFGYVYTMYANNKYLFVYTTSLPLYRHDIEKKAAKTKLYRFEKSTMEIVLLEDEMGGASQYARVFWQVFRVENDFVEAYVVKEATQHIVVAIARFDNNGKKIKSAEVTFDLKNSFPRQEGCTMAQNEGINNGMYYEEKYSKEFSNDVVYIEPDLLMIYPLASCHLHFDPVSKQYFAYGICGHDAEQKANVHSTDYTGFYLARIDEDYKLAAFKEYDAVPLLKSDIRFSKTGPAGERSIDAMRKPTDQLVLYVSDESEYNFSIDPTTLAIKKSTKLKEHKTSLEQFQYMVTTFTSSIDKELYWQPEIMKKEKFEYTKYYVPTKRWQYVILISDQDKKVVFYTSPML